jgi:hypothetical protein
MVDINSDPYLRGGGVSGGVWSTIFSALADLKDPTTGDQVTQIPPHFFLKFVILHTKIMFLIFRLKQLVCLLVNQWRVTYQIKDKLI